MVIPNGGPRAGRVRPVLVVAALATAALALGSVPAAAGPPERPTTSSNTASTTRSTTPTPTTVATVPEPDQVGSPAAAGLTTSAVPTGASTPPAPAADAPTGLTAPPELTTPSAPPAAVLPGVPAPAPELVLQSGPPEPHIITTFADRLRGARKALPRKRALSVPVRADVDGCNRNYGEIAQCIPRTLPAGQVDLCAYLAKRGIKAVRVRGVDTNRVDRNRNGIVCD